MQKNYIALGLTSALLVACASTTTKEQSASSASASDAMVSSSAFSSASFATQQIKLLSPSGQSLTINAEVAQTTEQQEQGLMNRTTLADDAGMFFPFDPPRPVSFWMKDTLIPLDILYFDANGSFITSIAMQPCTSNDDSSCALYPSPAPVGSALEVPAGYVAQHQVGEGWKIVR